MARARSSWWQDDPNLQTGMDEPALEAPNGYDYRMNPREFQLLERLRKLPPGGYVLLVTKTSSGKDGLHSFRVQEAEE